MDNYSVGDTVKIKGSKEIGRILNKVVDGLFYVVLINDGKYKYKYLKEKEFDGRSDGKDFDESLKKIGFKVNNKNLLERV